VDGGVNSYKIEYYFTDYVMADSPESALAESYDKNIMGLDVDQIKLYRIEQQHKKDLH
tara:strand:- start:341 stop:514 length:174 start_codon:yes stop_codon:yes gene_type:complete